MPIHNYFFSNSIEWTPDIALVYLTTPLPLSAVKNRGTENDIDILHVQIVWQEVHFWEITCNIFSSEPDRIIFWQKSRSKYSTRNVLSIKSCNSTDCRFKKIITQIFEKNAMAPNWSRWRRAAAAPYSADARTTRTSWTHWKESMKTMVATGTGTGRFMMSFLFTKSPGTVLARPPSRNTSRPHLPAHY